MSEHGDSPDGQPPKPWPAAAPEPRGPRLVLPVVVLAVAVAAVAAGIILIVTLGGGGKAESAAPTTTTARVATSMTTQAVSAGDRAACKAWERTASHWAPELAILHDDDQPSPVPVYAKTYELVRDQVSGGMAAATGELAGGRDAVVAALDGAIATTDAWVDGDTLDLSADLGAVYEASERVAGLCLAQDPAGTYDNLLTP